VHDWSRARLPVELVRRLKQTPLTNVGHAEITAAVRGDQLELHVDSAQEVAAVVVLSLPRGALTEAVMEVPIETKTALVPGAQGNRHVTTGSVATTLVAQSAQPLLRVRVTLASGDVVSRTWAWAELGR